MLIPELIKRAVAGDLRFEFIESSVSIAEASSLSSLKGRAHAEPARGYFHFHFLPRAIFAEDQLERLQEGEGRAFHLSGTERGSASWTGTASALRVIEGAQGPAVHAHVPKWTREDGRSVHASFLRIVLAGHFDYPVTVRHAAGMDAHTASINCRDVKIDFRNYGGYTEICAQSARQLPVNLSGRLVNALASMLDTTAEWVYREQHADGRRRISVKSNKSLPPTEPESVPATAGYDEFWRSYTQKLDEQI